MSDACMEISIQGHNLDRFARPDEKAPVEFEGFGPVTGIPHADLKDLFVDDWDWDAPDEAVIGMGGWSKYERDELHAYARGYTAHVPGSTATVTLEWHGEGGPLREVAVYRGGERVDGTHTEDVPNNLPELIAAVREAVAVGERAAEGESNDAKFDAAALLREAATALTDALAPPRA
ncbi:MAG: hypothetical protein J0G30_00105 [Actinomycetales bacterium]|nr:hypothetical protein [Actinomycetales bacterium]